MRMLEIPDGVGDVGSYTQHSREGHLNGASSNISEIYRSAFLRTLAWFSARKLISDEHFIEYSLFQCPIDLSLWDIASSQCPDWWPRTSIHGADELKIETLSEWLDCAELIGRSVEDGELLAAEGATVPIKSDLLFSAAFKLYPFAYSIEGPNIPSGEEMYSELRRCFWMKYPLGEKPVTIFGAKDLHNWMPIHDYSQRVSDLNIWYLIGRIKSLNINQWQPWRGLHPPFFPSLNLVDMSGRACSDASSWYYEVEGNIRCRCRDWKIGSLERGDNGQYMLHGQYAIADPKWIAAFLASKQLRLGHLLRMSVKYRRYRYDEAKEVQFHKLFNVGRIVEPSSH